MSSRRRDPHPMPGELVPRRTAATDSGPEPATTSRHLSLWAAIRHTREELLRWQEQASLVDGLFREHILPRETRLTDVHGELTEQLMNIHERDDLDRAAEALLILWIRENLQSLEDHPFVRPDRLSALQSRWQRLQTSDASSDNDGRSTGSRSLLDDLFDDELDEDDQIFDFGWHRGGVSPGRTQAGGRTAERADDKRAGQTDDQPVREDSHDHGKRRPGGDESRNTADDRSRFEDFEQRLSVERLFRQLARTLHPDREQDEDRKREKHELMSECLRARQTRDIDTLLRLYCEHVGELPDAADEQEQAELIRALEQQLKRLQHSLRQQRYGNSLQAGIVERYSASSAEATRHRIDQHARELDQAIAGQEISLDNLGDAEGLAAELAIRREREQDRLAIDSLTGYSRRR